MLRLGRTWGPHHSIYGKIWKFLRTVQKAFGHHVKTRHLVSMETSVLLDSIDILCCFSFMNKTFGGQDTNHSSEFIELLTFSLHVKSSSYRSLAEKWLLSALPYDSLDVGWTRKYSACCPKRHGACLWSGDEPISEGNGFFGMQEKPPNDQALICKR